MTRLPQARLRVKGQSSQTLARGCSSGSLQSDDATEQHQDAIKTLTWELMTSLPGLFGRR